MYPIKRILVPVDFSACSRAALFRALYLAHQIGAAITVQAVAESSSTTSHLRLGNDAAGMTVQEYELQAIREELKRFLRESELNTSLAGVEQIVESGRPRDCILRRAQEGHYDLIVMGTHGRTGRPHALVGSVAESIVRTAPCPVLTVREGTEPR